MAATCACASQCPSVCLAICAFYHIAGVSNRHLKL